MTELKTEYRFHISGIDLCIHTAEELTLPEHLRIFEISQQNICIADDAFHYYFCFTDEVPVPKGTPVAEWDDMKVYLEGSLETRVFMDYGTGEVYGSYLETDSCRAEIYLKPERQKQMIYDNFFCSLLALEKHAMKKNGFILHCAYNEYQKQAVLFSAPSETGKTTHANLWNQYLESRTVNGDRAFLRKIEGAWYACGWPICGSSDVCSNEYYPVNSIVMIHQAAENTAFRLKTGEAFRQLYTQITINRWNTEQQTAVMELMDQLICEIPVYQLNCNISEDAVRCIHSVMDMDQGGIQ